jgi:hypothetical protein
MNDEPLESELRRLPGVRLVAFADRAGATVVEVGLEAGGDMALVRKEAERLARYHLARGVEVEIFDDVGHGEESDPELRTFAGRVRLARAEVGLESDHMDFDLSFQGHSSTASAPAGDLIGAADATLRGLRGLGFDVPYGAASVEEVHAEWGNGYLVVLEDPATGARRRGLASGAFPEESVARAVLNALNRYLQGRQDP